MVRARTTNALLQYFFSHGVYVDEADISEAVTLEEHQPFLNTLSHDLSLTTKAVKLAIDIGTVSLAEKEKAMLAVYELERRCAAARGGYRDLQTAAGTLLARVRAWPRAPDFMGPLFAGLLGSLLIVVLSVPTGLALTGLALAYGGYKAFSFIRKKAVASEAIEEANEWFESQLVVEVTPRPTVRAHNDYVPLKAAGFAAAVAAAAAYTLIVYPHQATPYGAVEQVTHQADAVTPATAGTIGTAPGVVAAPADNRSQPVEDFSWLAGKYPSDVVNDKRFRSAFNGISRTEWRKISERLAVTNSAGMQLQGGYMVAQGCKEHACNSDQAAFAINVATGKGVIIVKEISSSSGNASTRSYQWPDLPLSATPLASWVQENGTGTGGDAPMATVASQPAPMASSLQASFNCENARSDAEHIICGDAELAADDVQLAAIFAKAKAATNDSAAFKERSRAQWNYREQQCHDRECLLRWYTDQKVVLTEIATTGKVAEQ